MQPSAGGTLNCDAFDTESGYDYVSVGGHEYSGHHASSCPDGIKVTAGETVAFTSDGSVSSGGFRMCIGEDASYLTYTLQPGLRGGNIHYATSDNSSRIYWEAPRWVVTTCTSESDPSCASGQSVLQASIEMEAPGGASPWPCELAGSEGGALTVTARTCENIASDALDGCGQQSCVDSSTWSNYIMGGCSAYSSLSPEDHLSWCNQDADDTGLLAVVACPVSCGTCSAEPADPTPRDTNCSATCAENVLLAVDQNCAHAVESLSPGLESRCQGVVDAILDALPERVEVSGSCQELARYDGEYALQAMTLNGHAHYKSADGQRHLVWRSARWILSDDLSQSSSQDGYTTASSFLGRETWQLECSAYGRRSISLTVAQLLTAADCDHLAAQVTQACAYGCSVECARTAVPRMVQCAEYPAAFPDGLTDDCQTTIETSAPATVKVTGGCYIWDFDSELLLQSELLHMRPHYVSRSGDLHLRWDGGDQYDLDGGRWLVETGTTEIWIESTSLIPPVGAALDLSCLSSSGLAHQGQASIIVWTCTAMAADVLAGPSCSSPTVQPDTYVYCGHHNGTMIHTRMEAEAACRSSSACSGLYQHRCDESEGWQLCNEPPSEWVSSTSAVSFQVSGSFITSDRTGKYSDSGYVCNGKPVYQRADGLVIYSPTGHDDAWMIGSAIEITHCRWDGSTSRVYSGVCDRYSDSPASCSAWQENTGSEWADSPGLFVDQWAAVVVSGCSTCLSGSTIVRTGQYSMTSARCNGKPVYQRADGLVIYSPTGHDDAWMIGSAIEITHCRWDGSTSRVYSGVCDRYSDSPASCSAWQENTGSEWADSPGLFVEQLGGGCVNLVDDAPSGCSTECAADVLPVAQHCSGDPTSFPSGFPEQCQQAVDTVLINAPSVLRLAGSCSDHINGDYTLQSDLWDGHAFYAMGGVFLFWSTGRWEVDDELSSTAHLGLAYVRDLDVPHSLGTHEWRVRCGTGATWRTVSLIIDEPHTAEECRALAQTSMSLATCADLAAQIRRHDYSYCSVGCAAELLTTVENCRDYPETVDTDVQDLCIASTLAAAPQVLTLHTASCRNLDYLEMSDVYLQPELFRTHPHFMTADGRHHMYWSGGSWALGDDPTISTDTDARCDSGGRSLPLGEQTWQALCSSSATFHAVQITVNERNCTAIAEAVMDNAACTGSCSLQCATLVFPAFERCSNSSDPGLFDASFLHECQRTLDRVMGDAPETIAVSGDTSCRLSSFHTDYLLQPSLVHGHPNWMSAGGSRFIYWATAAGALTGHNNSGWFLGTSLGETDTAERSITAVLWSHSQAAPPAAHTWQVRCSEAWQRKHITMQEHLSATHCVRICDRILGSEVCADIDETYCSIACAVSFLEVHELREMPRSSGQLFNCTETELLCHFRRNAGNLPACRWQRLHCTVKFTPESRRALRV